jgi:chromosome segregation ATPase
MANTARPSGQNTQPLETELDAEITALVAQVRVAHEQIADLEAEIDVAKAQLRDLLAQRGSNWSDEDGYARLVSEGTRIAYDTKALDDLIIKQPLHYGWLKDYRRESQVQGTVQVK